MDKHWTIISGTNRPSSNTKKVAGYIEARLRERVGSDPIAQLDLKELPQEIFRPEAYAQKPESFKDFEDKILNAKAIISVLPEYNGSAPGVFKTFIDMLPFPQSLQQTPCAFVGISAGRFGALRAIEQMQQVFCYRNAFNFPESIHIMDVSNSIDENGKPKEEFVLNLSQQILDRFVDFTRRLKDR